jgi:hypothetical protein
MTNARHPLTLVIALLLAPLTAIHGAVGDPHLATDEGNSLVDAAHIMPFSLFHNDDPRNVDFPRIYVQEVNERLA